MESDQRILAKVLSDSDGPFHPATRAAQLRDESASLEIKNVRYLVQHEDSWRKEAGSLGELLNEVATMETRVEGYAAKCSERLKDMGRIEEENRTLQTMQRNLSAAHSELRKITQRLTIPSEVTRTITKLGADANILLTAEGVRSAAAAMKHLDGVLAEEGPNAERYGLKGVVQQLELMGEMRRHIVQAFSVFFYRQMGIIGAEVLLQKDRFSKKGKLSWRSHDAEVFSVFKSMQPLMLAVKDTMGTKEAVRLARAYTSAMKPIYTREVAQYFAEFKVVVRASPAKLLGDVKYNRANLEWVMEAGGQGASLGANSITTPRGSGRGSIDHGSIDRAASPVSASIYIPTRESATSSQGAGVRDSDVGVKLDRAYAAMIDCLFDAVYREFEFLTAFVGDKVHVDGMLDELFGTGECAPDANFLSRELRELNSWVLNKCDKLYLTPVMSATQTYIREVEGKCPFLVSILRYNLSHLEIIHETYIKEQVDSIAQCSCNLKVTPLLPYFVKFGLLVQRTDRLNSPLSNVDPRYTSALFTAIANQIFTSLEIQAANYPKYTSLALYRHSAYFLHLYDTRFGRIAAECLMWHEERAKQIKTVNAANYIGGMLMRDAFPEASTFLLDVEAILTTHDAGQVQYHSGYSRPLALELARRVQKGVQMGVQMALKRLDKHFTRGLPAGAVGTSPDEEFHKALRSEATRLTREHITTSLRRFNELMARCYAFTDEEVHLMTSADIQQIVKVGLE